MSEKRTNKDFIVLKIDDCEIVFEKSSDKGSYTPEGADKPSEFLFEYKEAHRLTDRLVHVQHESMESMKKFTDIYIERSNMTMPRGAGSAHRIPLLRIISS